MSDFPISDLTREQLVERIGKLDMRDAEQARELAELQAEFQRRGGEGAAPMGDESKVRMATYDGSVRPELREERVPVKEVLVISGVNSFAAGEEFARMAKQRTDALIVLLSDGQTLQSLDRAAMLEHGWVRMDDSAGWRAFNRLSAAVSRHLARKQPEHPAYLFSDEGDDELHRAYTKVLRDIGPVLPEPTYTMDTCLIPDPPAAVEGSE